MGITRRFIFPTVRIILWAVIAVALVKIAFAGAAVTSAIDPLRPTAEIVEAHVAATTGTITNKVTVRSRRRRRRRDPGPSDARGHRDEAAREGRTAGGRRNGDPRHHP